VRAHGLACCLLLAASLAGCRGPERTLELVQQAEDTALAGRPAEALRAFDRALGEDPRAHEPFLVEYTSGWLHQLVASGLTGADAERELGQAEEHYRAALAIRPGDPAAGRNLVLTLSALGRFDDALEVIDRVLAGSPPPEEVHACLLLRGGLLTDDENGRADPEAARLAFRAAWATLPEDSRAPARLVELELRLLDAIPASPDHDARAAEVFALCRDELEPQGFEQIAVAGYEALLERCEADAELALGAWVDVQAERNALSMQTVARLPVSWMCPPVGRGIEELRELLDEPEATRVESLSFWNDTSRDPDRKQIFLQAKRSIARACVFNAQYEAAERILVSALEEARTGLGDSRADYRVQVDLALDLAVLYHTNRRLLDSDRTKVMELVSSHPLEDYSVEILQGDVLDERSENLLENREMQQVHTVLGLIYAEIGDEYNEARRDAERGEETEPQGPLAVAIGKRAWGGLALLHLQRAEELAGKPLPRLSQTVGSGLALATDPMEVFLESARGYLELDSRERALDVYHAAAERADATARGMRALDDLMYPRAGLYAGGSLGLTHSSQSAGDLQKELSDHGQDATVSLDGTQRGFKTYVGWRFQQPWAVELGFARFEGLSSRIRETNVPPATSTLLKVVGDEHPIAGEGLTLALQYLPIDGRRWQALTRAGLWLWKSDNKFKVVSAASGNQVLTKQVDERGLDPFVGLGLQYRLADRWSLRADVERYWLDRGSLDFLSAGLVFKF